MNFAKLSINIHIYIVNTLCLYTANVVVFKCKKGIKVIRKIKRVQIARKEVIQSEFMNIYKICNVDPMRIEEMKVRMFDTENKIEN